MLVNGARWVQETSGAVDLSAIPLALVERVEVLLDSASAIYGSDAIGGVINIITRKDYDGGEFGAYFGQTSYDDGERHAYDLSFGRKGEQLERLRRYRIQPRRSDLRRQPRDFGCAGLWPAAGRDRLAVHAVSRGSCPIPTWMSSLLPTGCPCA